MGWSRHLLSHPRLQIKRISPRRFPGRKPAQNVKCPRNLFLPARTRPHKIPQSKHPTRRLPLPHHRRRSRSLGSRRSHIAMRSSWGFPQISSILDLLRYIRLPATNRPCIFRGGIFCSISQRAQGLRTCF